ncbi:MAG: SGNH/GDSL hydrolase family protein [Janthinobacterium lividum]
MNIHFTLYFKLITLIVSTFLISCNKNNLVSPNTASNKIVLVTNNTITDTSAKTVVIIGSSTAAGTGATVLDSAWAYKLQNKFIADKRKIKVVNLAKGGFTTYNALPSYSIPPANRPMPDTNRNVTKALSYKPNLVIISMPTNDIANNYTDLEFTNNLQKIISLLETQNITYIISGTQPRNFSDLTTKLRLYNLNNIIINTYTDNSLNILNLLGDNSYNINPLYSYGDGSHVNDKGHAIIFKEIVNHKILKSVLNY